MILFVANVRGKGRFEFGNLKDLARFTEALGNMMPIPQIQLVQEEHLVNEIASVKANTGTIKYEENNFGTSFMEEVEQLQVEAR